MLLGFQSREEPTKASNVRLCAARVRLLATTALGGSLLVLSVAPTLAADCNLGQFNPLTATLDLQGTSCTLPAAAYGVIGNTAGYTITNTGTPLGILSAGQTGTTLNYSGRIIDGTGQTGLTILAGTNILSGTANTYGGPTFVQGGILIAGAANAFSPNSAITVQSGGTVDLGGYSQTLNNGLSLQGGTVQNGTVAGTITSAGGTINNVNANLLVTTGGATLVPNDFTFNILVGSGSSATFANTITGGGGYIGGAGTINANVDLNGTTLAPGAGTSLGALTPGTLTINGSLSLGQFSTLQIVATPAQASNVVVNGATTLSGNPVFVQASNGAFAPATTYKILTSTRGISGTFGSVSTSSAFLTPTLSYDADDAYVTLNRNSTQLQDVTTSPNQTSVAQALQRAGRGTRLLDAFLGLSGPQTQAALNAISGEGNVATQTMGQQGTRAVTSFLEDWASPSGAVGESAAVAVGSSGVPASASQYAALDTRVSPIVVDRPAPQPRYRVFATGFGGGTHLQGQGGDAIIAGQTGSYFGGLVGLDYRVMPNLLVGGAIGGNSSSFLVPSRGSSGSVTGFNGSLFTIATFGNFYGQSLTTLSSFSNNTTRNIAGFGPLGSAVEKADYGSFEARTRAEFGRVVSVDDRYGIKNLKITPFVALELANLATNGYSEHNVAGASTVFDLTTQGRTYADVRSFLGARFETVYELPHGMVLRPIVRLAYVHSYSPAPSFMNSFTSIPGSTFVVTGATTARNAAETKAGAELTLNKSTVVFANFEGDFASVQQVYGGRGGIRYSF